MTRVEPFHIKVVGAQIWDPVCDNIDVEVFFADGRRYSATFFTIRNIELLMEKNRSTGECRAGSYLWAASMIIVEQLSLAVIQQTVDDLVKLDQFEKAFCLLKNG